MRAMTKIAMNAEYALDNELVMAEMYEVSENVRWYVSKCARDIHHHVGKGEDEDEDE